MYIYVYMHIHMIICVCVYIYIYLLVGAGEGWILKGFSIRGRSQVWAGQFDGLVFCIFVNI